MEQTTISIDRAIATGEWSQEALTELDNLINDIENGRKVFKRFPQAATATFGRGNRLATKAAVVLRASTPTSGSTQRLTKLRRRLRDEAVSPAQERLIEQWARAENCWSENVENTVNQYRLLTNHSSEALVYYNVKTVIKTVSLSHFQNPQFAVDRIILHNFFFPSTAIIVRGFGRNVNGEFEIIVEQPFVMGIKPELEQIQTVIERIGFVQQRTPTTYKNDYFIISDLHQGNVLHVVDLQDNPLFDSDGTPLLAFIDTDMRLNTPDQGKDGKWVLDNRIV